MTCLCPDYVLEIARQIEAERKAKGIVDTRVLVRRGQLVLSLEPEELGPDDWVLAADDPYFRKKGRQRAVVEAWEGWRPGDDDTGA
ncbi:MAG TPA: hypothetical protein VGF29_20915 [Hyphomicrobiaceae bacterium]|jgi:hypothetical protein